MPRLEVTCAVLRLHRADHAVHREDVKQLGSEAMDALASLLRSYGFDVGRDVHVHQLTDSVLLSQEPLPRDEQPGATDAMPDETMSLAEQIRNKLDAGLLPSILPEKLLTGYGQGKPCHGCGQGILPAQTEYRFNVNPAADKVFRLHIGCMGLWLAELRRRRLMEPSG